MNLSEDSSNDSDTSAALLAFMTEGEEIHQDKRKAANPDTPNALKRLLDNNNNNDQGYYEPIILHDQSEIIPTDIEKESVYANSYVDLGKVNTVGFDYDYTLVTYTESLLELIYDMALKRLVEEKEYPREMMECGLKFDPLFSIRGEIVLLLFLNVCFVYDTI